MPVIIWATGGRSSTINPLIKTAIAAAVFALAALPTAASAVTLSGALVSANDVKSFDFTVASGGNFVTMRAFAMPAFDPVFSLFAIPTGSLLAVNDDFFGFDSYIARVLDAGRYRLSVTSYDNFPNGDLGSGFTNTSFYPDGGNFTVELTGATAVPEPASWALLIAGFGLTGAAMRRRRIAAAA